MVRYTVIFSYTLKLILKIFRDNINTNQKFSEIMKSNHDAKSNINQIVNKIGGYLKCSLSKILFETGKSIKIRYRNSAKII